MHNINAVLIRDFTLNQKFDTHAFCLCIGMVCFQETDANGSSRLLLLKMIVTHLVFIVLDDLHTKKNNGKRFKYISIQAFNKYIIHGLLSLLLHSVSHKNSG